MEDYKELIEQKNGFTLYLVQDSDSQSPREWDNLGTMVYWHRRYELGDVDGSKEYGDASDFDEWWKENGKGGIRLPLALLDHSGLRIWIGNGPHWSDSQGWDSGQVGWIYVTAETLRKEYGKRITKKRLETAKRCLESEVETYDQFLSGDVWGYILEGPDGKELDSCWGFFGHKYAEKEAKDILEYYLKEAQAEVEKVENFIEANS
jgi:hypothetical protein